MFTFGAVCLQTVYNLCNMHKTRGLFVGNLCNLHKPSAGPGYNSPRNKIFNFPFPLPIPEI